MNELFNLALIFGAIMVTVFALLFGWSWFELGGYEKAREHWKRKQPLPDMTPLLYIPAGIMFVLALLFSQKADAAEYTYVQWLQVDAGLEWQVGDVPFTTCRETSDNNLDKLGSNLGAALNLININDSIEINAKYTHHSCAVESDYKVYDAVGVQIGWRYDFPWYRQHRH